MKITKDYLRSIIKEELSHLEEAVPPPPPRPQESQPRKNELKTLATQMSLIWDQNGGSKASGLDERTDRFLSNISAIIKGLSKVVSNSTQGQEGMLKQHLRQINAALMYGGPNDNKQNNKAVLENPAVKALRNNKDIMSRFKKWYQLIITGGLPPEAVNQQTTAKAPVASAPPPPRPQR